MLETLSGAPTQLAAQLYIVRHEPSRAVFQVASGPSARRWGSHRLFRHAGLRGDVVGLWPIRPGTMGRYMRRFHRAVWRFGVAFFGETYQRSHCEIITPLFETTHVNASGRATDYRPSGPGRSHLGCFLHGVLEAPVGSKAEQELALPSWLPDAPLATRSRWVQLYLTLRATSGPDEDWLRVREERNQSYIETLGELVQSIVSDVSDVRIGEQTVFIRPKIAHLLQGLPRLPES